LIDFQNSLTVRLSTQFSKKIIVAHSTIR